MSAADHKVNRKDPGGAVSAAEEQHERERTKKLAERYRCAFVDLREHHPDPELFRTIPADLMFRFNFVPLEAQNHALAIAVADPSQVLLSDELQLLLGKKLIIKVATATQISDLLKRTEQSQRVLEQATEAFTLQVVEEEEETDETISADRLTRDTAVSPLVRLVDTVIFTALERRASDIHIEARPPGWALPRALQRTFHRLSRLHHALHSRRRRRPARARQRNTFREVPDAQPGRGWICGG